MLIPGFLDDDALDFLRFGQFVEIRLLWDIGSQEVGQSTLYYGLESPIPFWQLTSWANVIAEKWVQQVWRFDLLAPAKPALGRLVHQAHKLSAIKVKVYDSAFDLLTPDDATVTLNEMGLRGGAPPEDFRHVLNVAFDIRPAAVFQLHAPKRSYVALPAPSSQDFDARGFLSPVAMNEMRPHLASLSASVDIDGTVFPFSRMVPIRLKRQSILVGGNPLLAVGYGAVGSCDFSPRVGLRRSRVG